jgi:hypothetical protein
MFSFLRERPRNAHKAFQDALAYLIVLKHRARTGEFDWELANDFDGHKEVWTSIHDLIKAHIFEAFASKTRTLQRIELRRKIIVCEGDHLIYTRFLSHGFSDEERQILTDVMFNDRTLKENVAYMFTRSNILLATQLALRHIAQKYFNDSQERDYLFLWRSAYELMVEHVMRDKIASARGETYVLGAMIHALQSMVAEAEKRAYSGERIVVPLEETVQPKSEQPDVKRQRFYPGEIQKIAEFVFNRFYEAREASLYRLKGFQITKPENVLFIDTTLVWIELEALSLTPPIALAAFKEVLLAVAKLFKAPNVQTTDDVAYEVQAELKKTTVDAKPEGGWLADFMIIAMMYIYELDPTKFNAIEKRELGRLFADSTGDAWKVLARVRNICGYKGDEGWLGTAQ